MFQDPGRRGEFKAAGTPSKKMEADAAKTARESLELAFQISNILETGLDRHTLSLLIALCDRGVNPEALAALVRELAPPKEPTAASTTTAAAINSSRLHQP